MWGGTYIAHSCDVFHQFLVVLLYAVCCFVGHRLGLVHLPLGLEQGISSDFLILIEDLIAELMLLLLLDCPLPFANLAFIASEFVLVEQDLD
jgi:hypothetical protein